MWVRVSEEIRVGVEVGCVGKDGLLNKEEKRGREERKRENRKGNRR